MLRLAAAGLIAMGLFVVGGAVYLIGMDKDVPDGIIALGSAAVGALATLMTTSGLADGQVGVVKTETRIEEAPRS